MSTALTDAQWDAVVHCGVWPKDVPEDFPTTHDRQSWVSAKFSIAKTYKKNTGDYLASGARARRAGKASGRAAAVPLTSCATHAAVALVRRRPRRQPPAVAGRAGAQH